MDAVLALEAADLADVTIDDGCRISWEATVLPSHINAEGQPFAIGAVSLASS